MNKRRKKKEDLKRILIVTEVNVQDKVLSLTSLYPRGRKR